MTGPDSPPPQSMLWGRAPARDAKPECPFSVTGPFGAQICARSLGQHAACCEAKPTDFEPDE